MSFAERKFILQEVITMMSQELSCSINHRGCSIRAASYSVGPRAWLPEACVSLETERGLLRMWVRSFAHCFDAEKLTFPNKLDADGWALGAARIIVDRTLEHLNRPSAPASAASAAAWRWPWALARRPLQALRRFKQSASSE